MIDFDAGDKKRAAPVIGAMNLTIIALVIAILGLVCYLAKIYAGAAVFGGIGLVLGGYSMGFVRKHATGNIKPAMAMAAASLLISVIAFMFGFTGLFD